MLSLGTRECRGVQGVALAQQWDQSKLQGVSGEGSAQQGAQLRLCTLLKHCLVQRLLHPRVSRFFPGKIMCLQCGGAELLAFSKFTPES